LAKKSSSSQKMASPGQIHFVGKNGIKVYPISEFEYLKRKDIIDYSVISFKVYFIEVNNNGRIHLFEKKVSQNDLNSAIANTVIFYYNKLKEKK
jgi:hypothetical protein